MADEKVVVIETVDPSKFFDIFFRKFSYPLAGAIVRAIKVFLSILLPAVFAAFLDGSLLHDIRVIPQGYIPIITAIGSPTIIALEKYLREIKIIDDQDKNLTSIAGNGPSDSDQVAPPANDIPDPNFPKPII